MFSCERAESDRRSAERRSVMNTEGEQGQGIGELRSEECGIEDIVHQLQARRGDSHIGGARGAGRQHQQRRGRRLDGREERGQRAGLHCQVRTSTRYIGRHLQPQLPAALTR